MSSHPRSLRIRPIGVTEGLAATRLPGGTRIRADPTRAGSGRYVARIGPMMSLVRLAGAESVLGRAFGRPYGPTRSQSPNWTLKRPTVVCGPIRTRRIRLVGEPGHGGSGDKGEWGVVLSRAHAVAANGVKGLDDRPEHDVAEVLRELIGSEPTDAPAVLLSWLLMASTYPSLDIATRGVTPLWPHATDQPDPTCLRARVVTGSRLH